MRYHRPTSLAEALRLFAEEPAALFIAGGTDLMVRLREGSLRPTALVSLARVPELAGITDGGTLVLGALTTVAEIASHRGLAELCPVLAQAARTIGSQQIRNVATIGGNLCNASPCADLAPPLLVLEASVRIEGPGGRRVLPLADFFEAPGQTRLRPGELLTAIEVPRRSVAPRPIRLSGVEALLEADPTRLDEARAQAEREVEPIDDVRAGAAYRRHLVGALFARAAGRLMEARS